MDEKTYARFEMSRLVAEQLVGDRPYLEFLRHDTMSVGLYVLEAGATDLQKPHAEDELYYVVEGRAVLEVDGDQRPVQPGTLVFVPARMQHRFHSIAAKLSVLVFFAPAESAVAD